MAGSGQRYTAAQVIHALDINKGMVYLAAKSLGCSHVTVYNYAKRYPTVQRAIDANRGYVIDVAELKLYDAILAGEHWAVAFTLKTIGKHRGYVERQEFQKVNEGELDDAIKAELARVAHAKEAATARTAGADADAAD